MTDWDNEKKHRKDQHELQQQSMGEVAYQRELLRQNGPSLWATIADRLAVRVKELNALPGEKVFSLENDSEKMALRLLVTNRLPRVDLKLRMDVLGFVLVREYVKISDTDGGWAIENTHKIEISVTGSKIYIWSERNGPRTAITAQELADLLVTGFSKRNPY